MFVSVSDYYSEEMKRTMHIPDEKLVSVYIGVYPENYVFELPSTKKRSIGYVSRMSEELGLGVLVDAFLQLKQEKEFEDVELHITGGSTGDDRKFIHSIKKKISTAGFNSQVIFHAEFGAEGLGDFFKQVSVLSVPVLKGEAFGIYLLEAMASGIPIVQPALGAFPEIVKLSGGGISYEPNSPENLAGSLKEMLSDPEKLDVYGMQARKGVEKEFHVEGQVKEMLKLYKDLSVK
jgi:glycosyltransferase involved in cell wall biosynthesis